MKPAGLSPRFRRNLWIAGIVLLLFTLTGFFVLPPILKTQLEKRASAELGRAVTIGKVRLNPYALSLTLENFEVREQDGKSSFLGWDRLYVNFDALASLTGDWVLGKIELDGFRAGVTVNTDGSFNFSDILDKFATTSPAKEPAKPGRPLRIGSLAVSQARVDFADQSRQQPFATAIGPVTFTLREFRTAGAHGAPYHFAAVTDSGAKLTWTGTLSAEPLRSVGELHLENFVLAKYAPYYAGWVQADLVEGMLSVRGHYEINQTAGQRVLKFQDGALQLRGVRLLERASQEVAVELPVIDLTGINADALDGKVTIGSISLSGGHLRPRREKDGTINLLTMLQSPPADSSAPPAPAPAPAEPGKRPDFMIGEVTVKDFTVDVTDLAAPVPAHLGLSGIQVALKNVSLAEGSAFSLQLDLVWAPQGTLHVAGNASLNPIGADLKLEIAGWEIRPLSPYLEHLVNARITQGAISTTLSVQAALPEGRPLEVTVSGDVKVERFGLVDSVRNEDLAGVGLLALNGLSLTTTPQLRVALAEVAVTAPYARVVVNKDGTLNLASIVRTEAKPETALPTPKEAAPAPKIEIGRVVIGEGEFSFADRSVEPEVRMAFNQFAGTITGLSSENMAKADVDLKAEVDGAGPVAITGKLDPLGASKFVDLKVDFHNVDLLPLSPYSGRYAGYELARGKLLLEVQFLLDGRKIDATNVITLNQFTFGAPVQSPDATSLPVRLGVALLKDSDGNIVIDVPVQGNTDDPDFRIGKVVLRVIVNLLTKAAVSPFALLGSMFGGGGDELGYQEFTPGLAALQPEEIKKLEIMVKALVHRPSLSVDLEGGYDGPADTYALKRIQLDDAVRRAIWETKRAGDPNLPPPDQLVIIPDEEAAMVRKLFQAKYPPGTAFGAPLLSAPVASAAPVAPRSFLGRILDFITFKAMRTGKPAKTVQPVAVKPAEGAVPSGPSLEEMTGRLAETMEVSDNDLHALARSRAHAVRDYFVNVGKIGPERIFLSKDASGPAKDGKGPRVFLALQ